MRRALALALPCAVLAGCGTPQTISPQERAREAAIQRKQDQAQARAAAAQRAESVRHAEAEKKLQAASRAAAYDASQMKLDPLPPDVHQVGSRYFITTNAHASELRHVCTGEYNSGDGGSSGNDVSDVRFLPGGQIQVQCQGPQERFRSEVWEKAYEQRTGHR